MPPVASEEFFQKGTKKEKKEKEREIPDLKNNYGLNDFEQYINGSQSL